MLTNLINTFTQMAISKQQERQWQAEEDARTMARYQEILSDKGRMGRAVKAAKLQAADLSKRAAIMGKAATAKSGGRAGK